MWDDDSWLCRQSVARLRYHLGSRGDFAPCQDARERLADVPDQAFARSVLLIDTSGHIRTGAAALLCGRTYGQGGRLAWWCYRNIPLLGSLAEWLHAVAARRPWGERLCRWLFGPDLLPRQHRLARWLFLRLLGIVSLCAFASLYVQADGLFGSQGISPASQYLDQVADHAASMEAAYQQGNPDGWSSLDRYLYVPTILWLDAGDTAILACIVIGLMLSILLIFDVAPGPVILGLWLIYLSLVTVGTTFLMYQWDALLLEALFVSLFIAPWRRVLPGLRRDREPSRAGIWLVRLLVFKLMFMSGVVKLLANDHTWDNLTALDFHYFTQPIPNPISYYAHHLPHAVHAASTVVMFAIELILPFFIFGPRRLRLLAWGGFVLLMVMIGLTGNYGFFNALTVVLAMSLVDDTLLSRFAPGSLRARLPDIREAPRTAGRWARGVVWVCAVPILLISGMKMDARFDRSADRAAWTQRVLERTASFHTINSYGLFASMTTTRPEIEVQGSRDGIAWETYKFTYKPGPVEQRPRFAGLHMPRVDWQMWFAALRGCQRARWFHGFMQRLLEGSGPVRGLLERDPFEGEPPTYLRSTLYMYTFADIGDPQWWKRERVGQYCPTVTLRGGRLVRATPAGR